MKINITYRKKKGISMRIAKNGDVNVSAPKGMPRAAVLAFVEQHRSWIEVAVARMAHAMEVRDKFYGQLPLDTPAQRRQATARLHAIVQPLVGKYQAQMGVTVAAITYRRTTSRWGSCNPRTRRINLSLYLLLLPQLCIEHIVVHELAHILVPNHSPAFYAVMDQHFPRWREARALSRSLPTHVN